jgi:diaminohydroxyphosphoribosylaminopyrimidine deaminase/5-amino-6-(5-phosphoribosylamino)uracil reductase
MTDPDNRVNGKGIEALRLAGIQVETNVSEVACKDLLAGYVTHRTLGRPRVTLKAAITLDGYLAAVSGDSKWISSPQSRQIAHALRAESDAVLVGSQTVAVDDPLLTVRDAPGKSPLRIVLDSSLKTPATAKLFVDDCATKVLMVHTGAPPESINRFSVFSHVENLQCAATDDGQVRIDDLLLKLGNRGVLSLLVEGGQKIISAFLRAELADELVLFIAPKILGNGIAWTDYPNAQSIAKGLQLTPTAVTRVGDDILYRATITYCPA